jgi:hypothetical protein
MSKSHEQRADDRLVAVVTKPSLTDDVPTILTIRPAPGHPFAFLPGSDRPLLLGEQPPALPTLHGC